MEKVLVYCANGYGERVIYSLDYNKYEVVGLVDNNEEIIGKNLYGHTVYSPKEVQELEYDYIIISVSEYAEAIKKDLVETYKVNKKQIVVYQSSEMDIAWEEERKVIVKKLAALIRERNVNGAMAEVGVYKGDFARIMNQCFPERKLFLFDTFEGFDSMRDIVKESDKEKFKDTCVEDVLSNMSNPQVCIIKKGYFPDTAHDVEEKFSLVSLDCDLYEPILAGLEFFYPKLVPGGYIIVHDFGMYHYIGVKKAVYEFCDKYQVPIVPILDRCLSVIISK